jgi:hypothetical protein
VVIVFHSGTAENVPTALPRLASSIPLTTPSARRKPIKGLDRRLKEFPANAQPLFERERYDLGRNQFDGHSDLSR